MEIPKPNVTSQKPSLSSTAQPLAKAAPLNILPSTAKATSPAVASASKTRIVITAKSPSEALAKARQLVAARSAKIRQFGLRSLIGKYASETEKNLGIIFADAQRADAVLLFDEADALFGKRSNVKDAHNRFSSPPFSTLAEHIQAYRGTVIISSTQPIGLDPDLLRRYAFVHMLHH
jgi:hypothetical protein